MKDKEQLHREYLRQIRNFRLMDDDFMNACFDNNIEATELLVRIILDRPDLRLKSVNTQKVMKNLQGRDIRLDIDAIDGDDNEIDIEIQRSDRGAGRKRARYHSSILDAHLLNHSDEFQDLPETYVIFITEHDVIGGSLPTYTVDRTITELAEPFCDGQHIIYVNGSYKDNSTEIGKLMHDFSCTNPDDMYFKLLADKARYFKEDEEGVTSMCKAMEDMRNEAAAEAKRQQVVESVRRWLEMGLSYEQIAKGEGLTVEQVKEIDGQRSA